MLVVELVPLTVLVCFIGRVASLNQALQIGGLLHLSGSAPSAFYGKSALAGAQRAVGDINENRDVLPDYELKFKYNDTRAEIGVSMDSLYDMLQEPEMLVAFFGPVQSPVADVVAQVLKRRNVIQMSPGATSTIFEDRIKYPYVYRTSSLWSEASIAEAEIIRTFGWRKIATLQGVIEPHGALIRMLQTEALTSNFSLVISETFHDDPLEALQRIKDKDARIIVGTFFEGEVRKVFCRAFELGIYGANYVWMIPGYFADDWQSVKQDGVSCSAEDLKMASEGYLGFIASSKPIRNEVGRCGKTPEEFRREMFEVFGNNIYLGLTASAYDGVWALALALQDAERALNRSLVSFRYGDKEFAKVVGEMILKQEFTGMKGPIKFSDTGHVFDNVLIKQNVGGQTIILGTMGTHSKYIEWNVPTGNMWYYSGGKPPHDSDITVTIDVLQATPISVMATVSTLAGLGIILASLFLGFNVWYRKHKHVKMSSPKLNNIIAFGIMVAYVSVILLGIDRSMVSRDALLRVCKVRSWLIPIAFTLAFGGMFSKTWRVYSIVIANKTKRKVIRDRFLFGIIGVMLLLDFLILIPWQIIDPIHIEDETHHIRQTETDLANFEKRQLLYVNCTSTNNTIWMAALLIYKTFVVVFGVFLTWSTRNINVPGLNDSYYVGLSIYNTVICCVVAVPLSFLAVSSIGVTFALVSGFLLLCITASLCLLFFPKVVVVYRKNAVDDVTGIRFGIPTTLTAAGTSQGQALVPMSSQIKDIELSTQKEGTSQMNTVLI
ncbi:gamma-aminobutyric acid type B receptor subunit 2-like [Asterias rubens]|uniref:gamma-aminobutyric acid type B receptor subunit 2-like n=1 Tax=Asterias rubens TaxID=7604 RepID=UPI0014554A05|nr:gamma-aminobutyric acid type B receptor subunit 2-like [Asterias rubens]